MSEQRDWRLSWEATRFALIISCPFTAYASLMWLCGQGEPWYVRDELYGIGSSVYKIGYPLTRIIYIFRAPGQMQDSDHWWALPLINFLFFAQWMIWTQLVATGWQVLCWVCGRIDDRLPAGWQESR